MTKVHRLLFLGALAALVTIAVSLGLALPALATFQPPPVRVPGPSTIVLVSLGAAAAALVGRFIGRR